MDCENSESLYTLNDEINAQVSKDDLLNPDNVVALSLLQSLRLARFRPSLLKRSLLTAQMVKVINNGTL